MEEACKSYTCASNFFIYDFHSYRVIIEHMCLLLNGSTIEPSKGIFIKPLDQPVSGFRPQTAFCLKYA
jgi:hypothetical protein